jgi:8-oxo-dGTP pyrophosphatase MutT (NUDIX family)
MALRKITREIVSAVIFSGDNKILFGKKDPSKGGVYFDCWHIPGGGIDEDEDKTTALIREVKEETGLEIDSSNIELLDDKGKGQSEKVLKDTGEKVLCNMNFNVYKVSISKNSNELSLLPTDDLVELKWFDIQEIKKAKLTPPSVELFTRIGFLKNNN